MKTWKVQNTFQPGIIDFTGVASNPGSRAQWKPNDYMEQYLDAEFWKIMSNCTNVNSTVNTGRSINTKAKEIERFIGASILMSTIGYPHLRMFWQKSLRIPAVADVISRTRYFQIRSNLKVVIDLDVPDEMKAVDRLWKVRPITPVNKKIFLVCCMRFFNRFYLVFQC